MQEERNFNQMMECRLQGRRSDMVENIEDTEVCENKTCPLNQE